MVFGYNLPAILFGMLAPLLKHWLTAILILPAAFLLAVIPSSLVAGLLIYSFFIWLTLALVTTLRWVERNTASGVVGIAGFIAYSCRSSSENPCQS